MYTADSMKMNVTWGRSMQVKRVTTYLKFIIIVYEQQYSYGRDLFLNW